MLMIEIYVAYAHKRTRTMPTQSINMHGNLVYLSALTLFISSHNPEEHWPSDRMMSSEKELEGFQVNGA